MRSNSLRADLLLLLTAFIWGFAFVAQRMGMEYVGPYLFNAARFALGMPLLFGLVRAIRYGWPTEPSLALSMLAFVNGAVLMLFVGIAAPRLFGWVRLTPNQAH